MFNDNVSSTPSSPVLTEAKEPTNEGQVVPHIVIETIDKAPVRQEDLETHPRDLDRLLSPSTSHRATPTSTALVQHMPSSEEPQHIRTDLLTEQELKGIVQRVTGEFFQNLCDGMSDVYRQQAAANQKTAEALTKIGQHMKETNQRMKERMEEPNKRVGAVLDGIEARQAERRRKREAQNKDLNPNRKTT